MWKVDFPPCIIHFTVEVRSTQITESSFLISLCNQPEKVAATGAYRKPLLFFLWQTCSKPSKGIGFPGDFMRSDLKFSVVEKPVIIHVCSCSHKYLLAVINL